MALFTTAAAERAVGLLEQQYGKIGAQLGVESGAVSVEASPLYHDMVLLIEVANGQHMREDAIVAAAEAALGRVLGALRESALGVTTLSEDFWQSELGVIVSRTRWWVSGEDLITISNAAALAFGENTQATRMRIARAIDSGQLEWVPDPSSANPQHQRRVLRSQVERLGALRSLPE